MAVVARLVVTMREAVVEIAEETLVVVATEVALVVVTAALVPAKVVGPAGAEVPAEVVPPTGLLIPRLRKTASVPVLGERREERTKPTKSPPGS